jgi:hypothetical protein
MPHPPTIIRSAEVQGRRARDIALVADAETRAAVARDLGLVALERLELRGTLRPLGARDLVLEARLGARAAQPCVVTLEPVWTTLEVPVMRRYLADLPDAPPGETEMPEDDTAEPLPEAIDLVAVAAEALALGLPDYPRAAGAALGEAAFGPPGAAPLRDADVHPFAALRALRPPADDAD